MNRGMGLWIVVLSLIAAPTLAANKCMDENGRITYQALPCPADTQGGDMSLNVNRVYSGRVKAPTVEETPPGAPSDQKTPVASEAQPNQPVVITILK